MSADAEIVVGIRGETAGGKRVKRSLDDISRSGKTAKQGQQQLEQQFKKTDSAGRLLKNTVSALGVSFGIRQLQQVVDTYTNIQNRLKLVTDGTAQLIGVTEELFKISNETRQSFEGTAEVYARTALATKELGLSQRETLDFTKSLNQAVILSGASATESSAGLIQLSQGLASGTLRGDELRSVLEQLPAVADVISKGLGVTRGELRKMGEQGLITADQIIDAFADAREELNDKFGQTVPTIAQSFVVLKNRVIEFTGEMDEASGASSKLAGLILTTADNVKNLTVIILASASAWVVYRNAALLATGASILTAIAGNVVAFAQLAVTVRSVATGVTLLNAAFILGPGALLAGLVAVGAAAYVFRDELNATITQTIVEIIVLVDKLTVKLQELFSFGTDGLGALFAKGAAKVGLVDETALDQVIAEQARKKKDFKNLSGVSESDLRAEADAILANLAKKEETAGVISNERGERTAPTAVGKPSKETLTAQKELAKLIKQTSSEQETLLDRVADLNKLRSFADTAEEVQAIDRALEVANEQLLTASTAIPGLQDAFTSMKEHVDSFADSAGDAFGEVVTGSKSAKEALGDLLKSFASQLASDAFSSGLKGILGGILGGSGGGSGGLGSLLSGIGSSIFGGFKAEGGPVSTGRTYVVGEQGPELFSPGQSGNIIPNHDLNGGGGKAPVVINQTINVSTGVVETVRSEMIAMLPEFQRSTEGVINEASLRGIT
jgi:tape measure domain-containing protein